MTNWWAVYGWKWFCSWQVLKLASVAEASVDDFFYCFFLLIRSEENLSTADIECITKLSLICSVPAASYCSVNDPPANGGVINRTRLRPGSKLFYFCNRGYRLVGSSNATCRLHPNGLFQWDTAPPLCQGEGLYAYKYVYTYTHGPVLEKMHQLNVHDSWEVAVSRLRFLSGALRKELTHCENLPDFGGKKQTKQDTAPQPLWALFLSAG